MPVLQSSAIAGACAGLVSSIVTCPLDVVKTRLQAQGALPTPGPPPSSSTGAGQPSIPKNAGRVATHGAYPRSADAGASKAKSELDLAASRNPDGAGGSAATRMGGPHAATQTHPLKLSELRLQVEERNKSELERQRAAEKRYRGLSATVRRIWQTDGLRGFYRGLGPTIFGYLPTWAIYFTVYDGCKDFLSRRKQGEHEDDFLNHILSAMTAGAASTCATSPLWVVKTRFMLQSSSSTDGVRRYRHTGDAFVQIWKTEGIRGFYAGLLPSLFGVSHVAVQFPLYESFKAWSRNHWQTDELQPSIILTCSSGAKMIASVLTYPHEVLRTRLQMQPRVAAAAAAAAAAGEGNHAAPSHLSLSQVQQSAAAANAGGARRTLSTLVSAPRGRSGGTAVTSAHLGNARRISNMGNRGHGGKYKGVLHACAIIAREEGVRGFYRGMGVNLVRTVPSSALTILTYEVMMQHLTASPDGDDHYEGEDGQPDAVSDDQSRS
ncbi:mitochondrial carrier [Ceraceosorus guamensis]|uniref:Mitochondrial carrier n=1 Tax=Ceraceosorus guamensis TaxID=1522189 RepID=A0A316W658_9BASI|nr:mitochondrial carrier [Ceraceosorus guamensis]PWN45367.1 mitochondrial carrier [Ceraceosorus guamensis]